MLLSQAQAGRGEQGLQTPVLDQEDGGHPWVEGYLLGQGMTCRRQDKLDRHWTRIKDTALSADSALVMDVFTFLQQL